MVQGRVHPDCRNADNPYDECTQYCFTIIVEAKKRTSKDEPVREKKIVRALLFGQWIRSRQVLSLLGNEYQIEAYPKTTVVLLRNRGVYIWGETGISAKTQLKTRVVKNNLNPEWNEDLTPSITDTNLPVKLGWVRDYSPSGYSMPPRNQNSGNASEYGSAKYANQDHRTPKSYGNSGSMHSKDRSTSYQNETVEPCNFSSSIHYGGQEVYSTDIQPKKTHSAFKKDG